jgi:WD40 repeat protein
MLASGDFDHTVHLWDATEGRGSAELRGHTALIDQVIWNPDGTRVASASRDGTVKVWDTRTGKEALNLASHESQVYAVAWSPDGMILASAGQDRQIRIHDASVGYLAARAPQILPAIDRRLAADPSLSADWRLRAEVYAQRREWKRAAENVREYLLLSPHQRWFLFDCLVAGPYVADLKKRCLPEDAVLADTKEPEDGETLAAVSWMTVPHGTQGIVDFGTLIGRNDNTSAYALFPVYSLDDRQVVILVGADDRARLWLNGECLYESSHSRPAVADEDAISAPLKAGWNTLLVRVANETGDHELFLRLSDAPVDLARVRRAEKSQ